MASTSIASRTRNRSRATRTARSTSSSSAASSRARASCTRSRPIASCASSGYDCRLLLAGTGPQEREVRRYIATRRLTGVELLGRISDADKIRYFATADVYVSPATGQESMGVVLLEALASGTPIVCSDIHGYRSVVRRGEQGLLVPPRDVNALS